MTTQEIIPILEKWETLYFEFQKKNKAFSEIFGSYAESPLINLYWNLWRAYTEEISIRLGDKKDEHGYSWLDWYELECKMGKRPLKASATSDGNFIEIGDIKALARMIYETCSAKAKKKH